MTKVNPTATVAGLAEVARVGPKVNPTATVEGSMAKVKGVGPKVNPTATVEGRGGLRGVCWGGARHWSRLYQF